MEHSTPIRRPRRRPGENRERLIVAGIQEFAILGYRGASTSRIAARATVPQPHVYANFRTKQELFLACVSQVVEISIEAAPRTPRDGHHELLVFQALAAVGDPDLSAELRPLLLRLRTAIGRQGIESILARAAAQLL